jgi:hypothetical protein
MRENTNIPLVNRTIEFVPKKKNKKTCMKHIIRDEDGLRIRELVEVERHVVPHARKCYNYGRIQIDIDTCAIGQLALVQVYVPNHPIDEGPVSKLSNFLNQEGNEWTKLLESEEDRNARIRKEIAEKIRQAK